MNRWIRRCGWTAAALMLFGGLSRLAFDAEVLNLLPKEDPSVRGLLLHQNHFRNADQLILTIAAQDAGTAEETAHNLATFLATRRNLVGQALWRPPWIDHPDSLGPLIATAWLNQPPERLSELGERLSPDRRAATLEDTRIRLATAFSPGEIARLSYDPYGLTRLPDAAGMAGLDGARPESGSFSSSDGTFRVIFIKPAHPLGGYKDAARWVSAMRQEVAERLAATGLASRVRIGWTGRPAFVAEIALGMEQDLHGSVMGSLFVIGALFWVAYRRWRPLLWLLVLLGAVLMGTLAIGGWFFGTLNVVSLGFAAVLFGLAMDYALVLYQEAIQTPWKSNESLRRELTPGIMWSAVTTAGAFASLNLGALPGLAQLGSLVATGVLFAAAIMLFFYLPLARSVGTGPLAQPSLSPTRAGRPSLAPTIVLVAGVGVILIGGLPSVDFSAQALSPIGSPAQATLDEMITQLQGGDEQLVVLVVGATEADVARRLGKAEAILTTAVGQRAIHSFMLPSSLWPSAARQQTNLLKASTLGSQREALKQSAREAGFTEEAQALTDGILEAWQDASTNRIPIWPSGTTAQWLLEQCAARAPEGWVALGSVQVSQHASKEQVGQWADLSRRLAVDDILLTGWPVLGESMVRRVEAQLPWILGVTGIILLLSLSLAFRSLIEVGLSLASLAISVLVLLAVMSAAGWSWNLMNLTAVPLLLGAGVDYSIHTQLALRRHDGDLGMVRRTTGRALILCAGTTIAGFGSLAWAGNSGLASLGLVCATGVACMAVVSLGLLPAWWTRLRGSASKPGLGPIDAAPPRRAHAGPSSVYRGPVWRLGLALVRILPPTLSTWAGASAAGLYAILRPRRRRIVIENLLPVLGGDHGAARRCARKLFRQFGCKLATLLRQESGAATDYTVEHWSGIEQLESIHASGRGALIVTPHLGDWEVGGTLLAQRGYPLLVITQPEPGEDLTGMRGASRSRRGIETLVVGADPFAFVDVIRRLQDGGIVALLLDRPAAGTGVEVVLFGRKIMASVAAAELARASGCAILPVYVVRTQSGYAAHMLPEIQYVRPALGSREARRALTGEILRAFEPALRQYPDQWFHFVPIWRS